MPPRRTRKPQAAKRRGGASKRGGSNGLGWLWLLGGSALGAVIAVALYFSDQPRPERSPQSAQHKSAPAATHSTASDTGGSERHLGDIFEQPKEHTPAVVTTPPRPAPLVPPSNPTSTHRDQPVASTAPTKPVVTPGSTSSTAPRPAPRPTPRPTRPTPNKAAPTWWLQAGAFRGAGQADALKARLTLTGLPVKVVRGRGGNNILWYRVRVGPYRDKQSINRARQRLKQQKISPVLIKQ